MLNKIFHSTWFAVLAVILAGTAIAYKRISRQERAASQATQQRIQSDVANSIGNIKIEMKPLLQSPSENNSIEN